MTTGSSTTLILAMLIGAYLAAAGLGGLLNGKRWQQALDEFAASPALMLIAGAIGFIAGGAIIAVHHLWTDPLAIAVSLVGCAAMAKGLALIVLQDRALKISRPLATATPVWATAVLVLGLIFFAAGAAGKLSTPG